MRVSVLIIIMVGEVTGEIEMDHAHLVFVGQARVEASQGPPGLQG